MKLTPQMDFALFRSEHGIASCFIGIKRRFAFERRKRRLKSPQRRMLNVYWRIRQYFFL